MHILVTQLWRVEAKLLPMQTRCFATTRMNSALKSKEQQQPDKHLKPAGFKQNTPEEIMDKFSKSKYFWWLTRDLFTPNFRKMFNLAQDYALVYTSKNESYHLLFGSMTYLAAFGLTLKVLYDLTSTAQTYETLAFNVSLLVYLSTIHFVLKRSLPKAVYRIFYNQKTNSFALVTMKPSLFGYKKVSFLPQQVTYVRKRGDDLTSPMARLRYQFAGNFLIDGKPFHIDLTNFTSTQVVEAMFGGSKERAHAAIRLEESLRDADK